MANDRTGKGDFTAEMEERLEALKKRFQELEIEQMRQGSIEARQKLEAAQEAVTARRRRLERKLQKLRSSSGSAWDEVRDGVESAWGELTGAVERARKDFAGEMEEEPDEE